MVTLKSVTGVSKTYINSSHEILILGLFEGKTISALQKSLDVKLDNKLSKAIELDNFNGKQEKKLIVYGNKDIKRIIILGLGQLSDFTTDLARSFGSLVSKISNSYDVANISIDSDSFGLSKKGFSQAFVEGLVLGTYNFNEYKTDVENTQSVESIKLYGAKSVKDINKGFILAQSVSFARDLGNHPANILTPSYIANEAVRISKTNKKMNSRIYDLKDIKKMGMGAFYGVAVGATEPAKMIIVEYNGGNKNQKPIALVGKGLTFDSGGISIKPSPKMDEMKFDMCGSATVMGVLNAVAHLKPKINIIFAIGSTENMPDGAAQRPGDIVTAYNGKTIEVLNTDAEGRLVLADVLAYVNDKYKPDSIIDFATLTGAVLIALGNRASGVMGNNTQFMNEIKKASKVSSEKVWELPLWEEYSKEIKGQYADLQNIGQGRLAGTITAGAFLKEFVGSTPWVHVDIAGTAWGPKEPSYQPKVGATGVAVRMVYSLLEDRQ